MKCLPLTNADLVSCFQIYLNIKFSVSIKTLIENDRQLGPWDKSRTAVLPDDLKRLKQRSSRPDEIRRETV